MSDWGVEVTFSPTSLPCSACRCLLLDASVAQAVKGCNVQACLGMFICLDLCACPHSTPITCQVGVMILALASPRLVRTLPPSPVSLQTRVSFSGLAMI